MKTNYTQGIWHAKDGQIYPEETGKTLAIIPYFDPENEEQKANQQLIAAAPSMHEAITEVLDVLEGPGAPNLTWIKNRLKISIELGE